MILGFDFLLNLSGFLGFLLFGVGVYLLCEIFTGTKDKSAAKTLIDKVEDLEKRIQELEKK